MKLRFTRRAECELDRIQDFYERVGSSHDIVEEFDRAFAHLRAWPRSGHHRTELLDNRYRFWSVKAYLVVYALDDPWLLIVTVLHASRNLTDELEFLR